MDSEQDLINKLDNLTPSNISNSSSMGNLPIEIPNEFCFTDFAQMFYSKSNEVNVENRLKVIDEIVKPKFRKQHLEGDESSRFDNDIVIDLPNDNLEPHIKLHHQVLTMHRDVLAEIKPNPDLALLEAQRNQVEALNDSQKVFIHYLCKKRSFELLNNINTKPSKLGSKINQEDSVYGEDSKMRHKKIYACPKLSASQLPCKHKYKNPNGLKYHLEFGICSFMPRKYDEAKPYKCSVPGCDFAYKSPNGLKYHLEHYHK